MEGGEVWGVVGRREEGRRVEVRRDGAGGGGKGCETGVEEGR